MVHLVTDANQLPLVGFFPLPIPAGTLELLVGFTQEVVGHLAEVHPDVAIGQQGNGEEGGAFHYFLM